MPPVAPVLPIPDFTIIPPIGQRLEKPKRPAFVPDDFTLAARALAASDFSAARQVEVMVGHYRRLLGVSA